MTSSNGVTSKRIVPSLVADRGLKSLMLIIPFAKSMVPMSENTVVLTPEMVSYILNLPSISESIPAKKTVPSLLA